MELARISLSEWRVWRWIMPSGADHVRMWRLIRFALFHCVARLRATMCDAARLRVTMCDAARLRAACGKPLLCCTAPRDPSRHFSSASSSVTLLFMLKLLKIEWGFHFKRVPESIFLVKAYVDTALNRFWFLYFDTEKIFVKYSHSVINLSILCRRLEWNKYLPVTDLRSMYLDFNRYSSENNLVTKW